jgi:hypothetical protein
MADETFVDTKSLEWVASPYPGVFRKPLRFEEDGPRTTLHAPPGSANEVSTDTGALLLVTLPKPHIDLD